MLKWGQGVKVREREKVITNKNITTQIESSFFLFIRFTTVRMVHIKPHRNSFSSSSATKWVHYLMGSRVYMSNAKRLQQCNCYIQSPSFYTFSSIVARSPLGGHWPLHCAKWTVKLWKLFKTSNLKR